MKDIFVNLKRFDIPKSMGGICPMDDSSLWIKEIMDKTIDLDLGNSRKFRLTYMLPESLIIPATDRLKVYSNSEKEFLEIGCQGVFRKDVSKDGNFGAFTTSLPASAASNIGSKWSIIGHSEERNNIKEIIGYYDNSWEDDSVRRDKLSEATDRIINEEVLSALKRDMSVLLCVGESSEERGSGSFKQQQVRIKKVLRNQLERGLKSAGRFIEERIVIGYEPIWAIGPGKNPPGKEYISFVSRTIKELVKEIYGSEIKVVYGGGLKRDNAAILSDIETIDGGLVALTNFVDPIGFNPEELKRIIDEYIGN